MRPTARRCRALLAALVLILLISFSESADAATIVVTNGGDGGPGSLRQAVTDAAPGDTITFFGVGVVTLTSGELFIEKSLTLEAPSSSSLTVRRSADAGTTAFRIFHISGAQTAVTISGLTITNGLTTMSADGGGVFNEGATLGLINCVVGGNTADGASGGGVTNLGGTVNISDCIIADNSTTGGGFGGGIYNVGAATMSISDSTVAGNKAAGAGGGGIINCATLNMIRSTISNNTSAKQGGGLNNEGGVATLTNSTLSGNTAGGSGTGGAALNISFPGEQAASLRLVNCTVTNNSGTNCGGLDTENNNVGANVETRLKSTIVAQQAVGPDFHSFGGSGIALLSDGYNIDGDGTSSFANGTNADQVGSAASPLDAKLVPLASNGGPTQTHALLPGSPAIDKGNSSGSSTDQRGMPRPFDYLFPMFPNAAGGDGSDVGAYELQPVARGQLFISEFRMRGPNGALDEFVEVYNNTDSPLTVNTGSTAPQFNGLGLMRFNPDGSAQGNMVIPNGTTIPARGHFLIAGANYGLSAYAAPDALFNLDGIDNAGWILYDPTNQRLDQVAFDGIRADQQRFACEGTCIPSIPVADVEQSFVRRVTNGVPQDTDNNAADFVLVSPAGAVGSTQTTLGASGPENLSSPIQRNAQLQAILLDATVGQSSSPNRSRDLTSDPANNSTFGTMTIRRRVVNNTGAPVTRLRFRVVNITGFPARNASTADLRPNTSANSAVGNINDPNTCAALTGSSSTPCVVTVLGTALAQPPNQPAGGGLNSTLSVAAVAPSSVAHATVKGAVRRLTRQPTVASRAHDTLNLAAPLAAGDSINVQFVLGVQKTGSFSFYVNVEALP
jgi:hypothetical protein